MKIPLPVNLPISFQVFLYLTLLTVGFLFALAMFLLKRFISKQDSSICEIKRKLSAHEEAMLSATVQMNESAGKIYETSLSFQQRVNDELYSIRAHAVEIESTLERTKTKADELEAKFDRAMGKVDHMNEKLEFHDKAISSATQTLSTYKKRLSDQDDKIALVVKRVTNNTTVVSSKRPKK